ncbi:Uncharacterized protein FWK35_00023642 [Aphis craccivora]|uniref:Uncharacterized protein n=1 Tax=Aphis craccivora TaxID=307492 RepID=A0A6G0Y9R6_APHCR|nr:Uncharacterized protein FWK35_00023642 [Aphis craccivora]
MFKKNEIIFKIYCLYLNSERSDECIDFTMMCFFFFCVCVQLTSRNNAPISNFGGDFRCKSEYPWCIIEVKILKKMTENGNFYAKPVFDQIDFCFMVVIQKLITENT